MPPAPAQVCCVRLAREKNALLFADVVVELAPFLVQQGIRPLLCGAAADGEYAAKVKARLQQAAVEVRVVDSFLGPPQLAEIYKSAVLNFHPCHYDAYGMPCAGPRGELVVVVRGGFT